MTQLSSNLVVEPFGEVNIFPEPNGPTRVRATILMKPAVEGAQTGLAIDGSASMQTAFGGAGAVSALFASSVPNIVQSVGRTMASFLANFDSDGLTTVIYWACGPGGSEIEELGDINAEQSRTHPFSAPKAFGTGTKLVPALKYFTMEKFSSAPWAVFVFITDGIIEDIEEVKSFTLDLGKQIAEGRRNFVKLVLIGVGSEADVKQMEELDDLDYGGLKDPSGNDIDIWDHKLAAEMQKLEEVFAEVVSANTILAPSAQITDDSSNPVTPIGRSSYADGLPALLEFTVPADAKVFRLVLPDGTSI